MTDEFWSKFVYNYGKGETEQPPPPFSVSSKCYITDSVPVENSIKNAAKGTTSTGRILQWNEENSAKAKVKREAFLDKRQETFISNKLHILPLASLVLQDL
jgi:hypothetical protein